MTSTPSRLATSQSPSRTRRRPAPPQPTASTRGRLAHPVEEPRRLVEHDERTRARERASHVRVRVDVLDAEVPDLLELRPDEERRRERQAAAEPLADAEDVRMAGARPHLPQAAE